MRVGIDIPQDLEGYAPLQFLVFRLINGAHPAPGDAFQERVLAEGARGLAGRLRLEEILLLFVE